MKERVAKIIFNNILCVILSLSLILSFFINYMTFIKQAEEQNSELYYAIGKPYIDQIEQAISYGKSIDDFYGIDVLLDKNKAQNSEIQNIVIATTNGIIMYATNEELIGSTMESTTQLDDVLRQKKYTMRKGENGYEIDVCIKDEQQKQIAIYGVQVEKTEMKTTMKNFWHRSVMALVTVLILGNILLVYCFRKPLKRLKEKEYAIVEIKEFVRKEMKRLYIGVIIISQLCMQIPYFMTFNQSMKDNMQRVGSAVKTSVMQQITGTIEEKRISYEKLDSQYHLQEWAAKYAQSFEEVQDIVISKERGRIKVTTSLSQAFIRKKQLNLCGDVLTLILVETLMIAQVLVSLSNRMSEEESVDHDIAKTENKSIKPEDEGTSTSQEEVRMKYKIGRVEQEKRKNESGKKIISNIYKLTLVSFFMTLICYLPCSFIPMMVSSMQGGDSYILCAMAVGIYFLGNLLGEIFVLLAIPRIRLKLVLRVGFGVLIASMLVAMGTTDLRYFIAARLFTGIGESWMQIAVNSLMTYEPDIIRRESLFSSMKQSRAKGIACGLILGALLNEKFSKLVVFSLSAAMMLLLDIICHWRIGDMEPQLKQPKGIYKKYSTQKKLEVVSYSLLIVVPSSSFIMFLYYYVPTYFTQLTSYTAATYDIRNIFLLYGLGSLCTVPIFRGINERMKPTGLVTATVMLMGMSFAMYAEWIKEISPMIVLFSMVIFMAFINGIGEKAQRQSFNDLTKDWLLFGKVESNAFYSGLKKIGMCMTPIIFSMGFNGKVFIYMTNTTIVAIIGVISLGALIVQKVCTVWQSNETYNLNERREEGS